MRHLWEYARAVGRHWRAGITGGMVAVVLTISATFHPLSKLTVAAMLLGYLVVAAYYAWREERQKIRFRDRREILKSIIDAPREWTRYENGIAIEHQTGTEPMENLIAASDDFQNEEDVEWVCSELNDTALKSDPFILFEGRYGKDSFKGKRLKFLRDARVSGYEIKSDDDALNYINSIWADKNGLKKATDFTHVFTHNVT